MTKIFTASTVLSLSFLAGGCASMGHDKDIASAPPAVRDAITKAVGDSKPVEIEKENEDGKTLYEAKYDVNGVEHTVTVDEAGNVIEDEAEVKVSDLPPAVAAAVLKAQPLAHVKEAALVKKAGQSYYEVDASVGEDKHELTVGADGTMMGDKVEAEEKEDGHHDGEHKD